MNQQQSEIQLNHGDIPGYMEAMTMTYALKDWSIAEGLRVGDRVEFTLEDVGGSMTISGIGKL